MFQPQVFLSPPLSLSVFLSPPLSLSVFLSQTHSLSLSLAHSLALSRSFSLSLSVSVSLRLSLYLVLVLVLVLSVSVSVSRCASFKDKCGGNNCGTLHNCAATHVKDLPAKSYPSTCARQHLALLHRYRRNTMV